MPRTLPHSRAEFPLPEWKPVADFSEVTSRGRGGVKAGKQTKGILKDIEVRKASQPGGVGRIAMDFYRSRLHATHSDMLHDLGLGGNSGQPIMPIDWQGHRYFAAAHYTVRAGRREPIEATLMLGSNELGRDVKGIRGYGELRATTALALGFMVANRELGDRAANAAYDIHIVDNFQHTGTRERQHYIAPNLMQLAQKVMLG